MNKIFYTVSLILLLSFSIFAQPGPKGTGPHGPGYGRNRRGGEFDKRLGHDPLQFFRKIGITLTDEQAERMYDIAIKFITEEEPIRLEIERIENSIRLELMKDNTDRNAIKELIKQKKEQEASLDYLRIVRDLDIIAVLTPEQKAQLNSCMMR
ncbi:periplasmic heavy metal sensor [Brachyspira hyodysenteriae]|uniref:Spy/CpxP family protein refolding chaperone n=1 Tax=Brachyspira hyodysenteriae TaxID=159 RepID=UPI002B25E9DC|nr:periplasmic heavy metal sensor [Brachyspira hyodysenteriae]WPC39023.1 periplasmic heavy metal sensor [Brachyspira hyodysenteriae]